VFIGDVPIVSFKHLLNFYKCHLKVYIIKTEVHTPNFFTIGNAIKYSMDVTSLYRKYYYKLFIIYFMLFSYFYLYSNASKHYTALRPNLTFVWAKTEVKHYCLSPKDRLFALGIPSRRLSRSDYIRTSTKLRSRTFA